MKMLLSILKRTRSLRRRSGFGAQEAVASD